MSGIIEQIKGSVTILDVINHFGGAYLDGKGSKLSGWHKVHESQSKNSLHVDLNAGLYHCKNCGEGGDLFDWVGHVRFNSTWNNRDKGMFGQVLREIARFANVEMPEENQEKALERRGLEELFQQAAAFYHAQLTPERRKYLHSRGYADETVNHYRLGYAPGNNALFAHLSETGVAADDLLKTGLFRRHDTGKIEDLYQGRFIFPYLKHGRVVYFIGRITDLSPKWEQERRMKYCKLLVHSDSYPYVSDQVENRYFYGEDSVKRGGDLLITEGVADCLSALQAGFACVSPGTVQFAEKDHVKILEIARLAGTVYICNDNEDSNAGIKGTLATAKMLWQHGKIARLVTLPRPAGVEKVDLNDFLSNPEQGPEAFKKLLSTAKTLLDLLVARIADCDDDDTLLALQREAIELISQVTDPFLLERWRNTLPAKLKMNKGAYDLLSRETADQSTVGDMPEGDTKEPARYKVVDGAICMWNSDAGYYRELCNFNAAITADVMMDDGKLQEKYVEIVGKLANGRKLPKLLITATEFGQMNWYMKSWGPRCRVGTTNNVQQHLRYAIQALSEETMIDKSIYLHSGWRIIDGQRVFLHGGGAVGADGIEVQLQGRLSEYVLPANDDNSVSDKDAMIASLSTLDLGDHRVTFPIYAVMYLAPLTEIIEPAFTLWAEGESGAGKSTITSYMLGHFGASWNYKHLPTGWETTANELERICFEAKDLPLIIDDYRPPTDKNDDSDMRKKVQRIMRAVGNRMGRGRMSYGGTTKPTYDPRGVVISTAELNTGGQSTLARQLVVRIYKGMVKLDEIKRNPHDPRLPYAMRGFIRLLAANWDNVALSIRKMELEWHDRATSEHHGRVPGAALALYCSFGMALWYAVKVGAIQEDQMISLRKEFLKILDDMAGGQQALINREKSSYRFINALANLLIQGRVFIPGKNTDETGFGAIAAPKIGWHNGTTLMLIPDAAINAVAEFYSRTSQPFLDTTATLGGQLAKDGWLVKTQGANMAVKTWDGEGYDRVYHLSLERIIAEVAAIGGDYDDIAIAKRQETETD